LRIPFKIIKKTCLTLAVLLISAQVCFAQSSAMVVGLEDGIIRCSGGAGSGLTVGDRVTVRRGAETIGWAEIVEIGEYQTWARYQAGETPKVGDRVLSGTAAREGAKRVTHHIDFEARPEGAGGGGFNPGSLVGLYGIYNLIEDQRYYSSYSGDDFYRTSSSVNLALGVASFLFNQFGRSRGPKPQTAKARFELSMLEQDLRSESAPVEVMVEIRNIGWHELRFETLDEHVFLLDREGVPMTFEEMDAVLHDPLKPGESVQGMMRFPAVDLGPDKIKFAFQDILGEQGELTFRRP
jgi:hypothetical protein